VAPEERKLPEGRAQKRLTVQSVLDSEYRRMRQLFREGISQGSSKRVDEEIRKSQQKLSRMFPRHFFVEISNFEVSPFRKARPVRVVSMLEEASDQVDRKSLGEVADKIVKLGSNPKSTEALVLWMNEKGERWLHEKRSALGAFIEAGARLSLPKIEEFIAQVLAYRQADSTVVSIAAQRLRLLQIRDRKLRQDLWQSLRFWIELWLREPSTEDYAALALPSVACVASPEALGWLSKFVATANEKVAWSSALGLLDWAANADSPTDVNEQALSAISETCIERFVQESERASAEQDYSVPLLPTLVWVLGAAATETQLPRVTQLIAHSFQNPRSTEDAAALRAGRLLVRRWRENAWKNLAAAFGGCDSSVYQRYCTALMITIR
jgi:hypothetical protein